MKLNTQIFKDFFALTKAMKPNTILPVYSYIKLSKGTLEKSNGGVYCKFTFDCEQDIEPVLLEELEMQTIVNNGGDEIELIIGDTITAKSGKLKISFGKADVADFKSFDDIPGDTTPIDSRIFATASKYVDPKNIGWMQYPVADNNGVLGTDGFKIFYHNTPMPSMVLSTECCNIIGSLQDVSHYATDNTDFFVSDGLKYGFTKVAQQVPNFMFAVEKVQQGGISVSKQDLLLFCNTCIPRSEKAAIMKDAGNGTILLQLLDGDKNKTNEITIDAPGSEGMQDFRFYPKLLASALSPLPYSTFTLHVGNNLSLTTPEDEKYKGILSQLIG
jgi:hypothetical protein